MTCSLCGREILDQSQFQIARQVVGWDIPRRGGGQNQLRLRRETGAVAHAICVTTRRQEQTEQLWTQSEM